MELQLAASVVQFGDLKGWEFAAYLNASNGKVIELRTLMDPNGADPSQDVLALAKAGTKIVVHHNHLSQESLSLPDWKGAVSHFDEIWAHTSDGSTYFGRAINPTGLGGVLSRGQSAEMNAQNALFSALNYQPAASELSMAFRKEVLNRAMKILNYVDYKVLWGNGSVLPYPAPGPAGLNGSLSAHGKLIDSIIDQAAAVLAPQL